MHVSIGEAARMIGVAISTLRRWEKEGHFIPSFRTPGKHRRYEIADIEKTFHKKSKSEKKRKAVAYARVSSHDQKEDLQRQIDRLKDYCQSSHYDFTVISDLGSGINYQKKGLNKLISLICCGDVSHLILTHKDRLLRFGSSLLFKICEYYGTQVIILDDPHNPSFEQQLVTDVLEIITVYSAKLYGKRSHSKRKKVA